MSGEISVNLMRRLCKACMACVLLASVACFSAPADAAEAQLNWKVPPGKTKKVRVKDLPKGTSLGVKVIATGSLVVILVHEDELRRNPASVSPVFQGTLDTTLTFSVVIPDSGHYLIILDNRRGASERQVRILIQAQAPKSRDKPAAESNTKKEKI